MSAFPETCSIREKFSNIEKHENKNVTPEQADDFIEFLKNVFKSPAALSEFTVWKTLKTGVAENATKKPPKAAVYKVVR